MLDAYFTPVPEELLTQEFVNKKSLGGHLNVYHKGFPKITKAQIALIGVGEQAHKIASRISGGQKQRIAIARSLINNPSISMGDEPTGNLDSKNSANVFDILKDLSTEFDLSLLVVTHDHDFAAKTDRIITMEDGRIISHGQ